MPLLLDIDECELSLDDCAEVCIDSFGSYTCGCFSEGFRVVENNQSCIGKLK